MANIIRIHHISELSSHPRPSSTLMGIFAHPDDESLLMGGAFALAKAERFHTSLITITRGELGGKFSGVYGANLAATRSRELAGAARILHVDELNHMEIPDQGVLRARRHVRDILIEEITRLKPRIIVTHDRFDPKEHQDHKATSLAVMDAAVAIRPRWEFTVLYATLKPNTRRAVYALDISKYIGTKIRACRAHASQGVFRHLHLPVGVYYGLNHFEYFVPYENKTAADGKRHYPDKK